MTRCFHQCDFIDKYVIASIFLVYLIAPIIFQISYPESHRISLEIWCGLIFSALVSYFLIASDRTKKLPDQILQSKKLFTVRSILIFLVIFLTFSLINLYYDVTNFSTDLSRDEIWYKPSRSEAIAGRSLVDLILSIGNIFVLIFISDFFNRGKSSNFLAKVFATVLFLLNFFSLILTSVHRSPLVFELIFAVFFYRLYIKKIKFNLFVVSLFAGICLMYLSWSAFYRAGVTGSVSLLHGMSGVATASGIEDLRQALFEGTLSREYGLQLLYNFISWIPRVMWPEKPITSFSFRVSEYLYGDVGVTTWVRTFSVPGEGYLQFGVIGMVAWSIIFVYAYRLTKEICFKYNFLTIVFIKFWVAIPIMLRADLSSVFGTLWFYFFGILAFFVFLNIVRVRNRCEP